MRAALKPADRPWRSVPRRSSAQLQRRARGNVSEAPLLPEPLAGAVKIEAATLKDVPTSEDLAAWLAGKGLDTAAWGQGDTKPVSKFWKELKLEEAGLELWQKCDGQIQPVRVTHVLRAKVCSPESWECNMFLFNTWQQYGDGRKRTRNGLLSEKLSTSEMPLEDHLHAVCTRAVTEEEMAVVVDSSCKIAPGGAVPEYDPIYQCPLKVVDEVFVDHTVEIELSKSYPGLLTMYHLYTVDIMVDNLPIVDFNTLEFEHPEKGSDKSPKLKYIHAWSWLEWSKIQRYLFEGSSLKERKTKGSFESPSALQAWLGQFALPLHVWGTDRYRSVQHLHSELEEEQTQLELWSRHDGVPLLMRVVHVIQLKVSSADSDEGRSGKFLFQVWQQAKSGVRTVNRFPSKKIPVGYLPLDKDRFFAVASEALQCQLGHLVDSTFRLRPDRAADRAANSECEQIDVEVISADFEGHHFDLEESPSYRGMHTMYHLYTLQVECGGLPLANFTTIDFGRSGGPYVDGWSWVTWQESLNIVHGQTQALERQENIMHQAVDEIRHGTLQRLAEQARRTADSPAVSEIQELAAKLDDELGALRSTTSGGSSLATMLPPSMISKMAEGFKVKEETERDKRDNGASPEAQPQATRSHSSSDRRSFAGARSQNRKSFSGAERRSISQDLNKEASGWLGRGLDDGHGPRLGAQPRIGAQPRFSSLSSMAPLQEEPVGARHEELGAEPAPPGADLAAALPPASPTDVREAAKAEFKLNGVDAAGLIDRDALAQVIQLLCPAQAAHCKSLLDMVGPAHEKKVQCSAFLDYIFAD